MKPACTSGNIIPGSVEGDPQHLPVDYFGGFLEHLNQMKLEYRFYVSALSLY